MAPSKFIEVLDTTTQPTYSGYNVSLEDILAETQRRSSTGDICNNPSSKPRNNSNSGASTSSSSSADSTTPTSPTSPPSPTMRNRLRRFTLGGVGAKHR